MEAVLAAAEAEGLVVQVPVMGRGVALDMRPRVR